MTFNHTSGFSYMPCLFSLDPLLLEEAGFSPTVVVSCGNIKQKFVKLY